METAMTWARRAVALAIGLVAGVAGVAWAAAPAAALHRPAPGPRAALGWPLLPAPAVVTAFDAPAGPYSAGHRGVDLAGPVGSSVLAAGDGVVAFAGMVAGRGVLSVDHAGGLRTTYEPVTALVRAGEPVVRGRVIGVLAWPGSHCLPQACLHWGLRRGGTYLDPLGLIGDRPVRLLPVWSAGPSPPDRGPLLARRWGR